MWLVQSNPLHRRVAKGKIGGSEVDPGLLTWPFSHMETGLHSARWPGSQGDGAELTRLAI